jgi:predicted metal-dependent peptidase
MITLTPLEKILKAKIRLQESQPFFSYLLLKSNIKECPPIKTMGVDRHGNMFFCPEWVNTLPDAQVHTVLCHEILHVALGHIWAKGVNPRLANIAQDIKVNSILIQSGFCHFPASPCVPDTAEHIYMKDLDLSIDNITKKTWQAIYDMLKKACEEKHKEPQGEQGFDNHDNFENIASEKGDEAQGIAKQGKGSLPGNIGAEEQQALPDNSPLTDNEKSLLEEKWKEAVVEALTLAKQRGTVGGGIEGLVEKLITPPIPWTSKLYRFIQRNIIQDYTYQRPHKKSFALGVYYPNVLKENMSLVCHLDSSGSMAGRDISECLDQLYQLLGAFSNIEIDLIIGDTRLTQYFKLTRNSRVGLKDIKIKGWGGTSHKFAVDWIKQNKPNCTLFLSLTDGYSDIDITYKNLPRTCNRIVVLPHKAASVAPDLKAYADIIQIGSY